MNIGREHLPFRKNCEGYFVDEKGNVLAKKTEYGIVVFPGGGVDEGENMEKAIIRETFEETGAVVNSIKKLGNLKFVWSKNWAQTEKQKKRYEIYQGEDMHFFSGKIEEIRGDKLIEEDAWLHNPLIQINEVIKIISSTMNNDKDMLPYRKVQLKFLGGLR